MRLRAMSGGLTVMVAMLGVGPAEGEGPTPGLPPTPRVLTAADEMPEMFSFDPSDVERYQGMRPSVDEYYRSHYARLLEEQERLWQRLGTVSAAHSGQSHP